MRKMATIRKISKITPIEGAEFIEVAEVDGWRVVVKKGEYQENTLVVFCEIDSFVPSSIAPFLTASDRSPKEYLGVKGERLKSKKLRGVISQGLILPLYVIKNKIFTLEVGADVSELLGIVKYDPPMPAQLAGQAKGNFPSLVPKTDQERIQNIKLENYYGEYEVTEKIEGCFLAGQLIETWEGASVKIKDIVNNGVRPKLVGVDSNGKVVPCEVTRVFRNGKKDNWVEVSFNPYSRSNIVGKSGNLIVTSNHKVFLEDMSEVEAGSLVSGDKLLMQSNLYCDKAMHYFKSSLLGDGSVGGNGHFSYNEGHASKYKEYVEYIKDVFSAVPYSTREQLSGKGSLISSIRLFTSPQLRELRSEWYPNDKKTLPADISWMDDFSVAKWYMDDGSLSHSDKQNDRAVFSTNTFSKEDVNRLANKLVELYGVDCTVYQSRGWCLRVNYANGTINNMWRAIAKHIHPSLRYKLPVEYRGVDFTSYGQVEQLNKSLIPVTVVCVNKIEPTKSNFPSGRVGYDIETTTHNYFCGGVLVHNSSMTCYLDLEGNFEVCSRNLSLKEDPNNSFWKAARMYNVEQKMKEAGMQGFAIQGELIGEGIQGNIYNIKGIDFYVYDVYDVKQGKYLPSKERITICTMLWLKHVPIVDMNFVIDSTTTKDQLLIASEDFSKLNPKQQREGCVYKNINEPNKSMKTISNRYLLKAKD